MRTKPAAKALISNYLVSNYMTAGAGVRVQRAARIAAQMRSGVAGSSTCSTPSSASASTIALTTAPSAGVVPPASGPRSVSGTSGRHKTIRAIVSTALASHWKGETS